MRTRISEIPVSYTHLDVYKRQVYKYTLVNRNKVSASFITLGGVWVSMMVPDRKGQMGDVVLGYDDLDSYRKNPPHFGAPVGRNANRIGGAVLTIAGKEYPLAANDGPNNLHSGPNLYHDRVWSCQASDTEQGSRLDFYLESPDGDQGYPGNAKITVSYTLTDDNSLILDYHMVCDADKMCIRDRLIYDGHVYIAMPPLFKVIPKRGEEQYLYDEKELERYRRSHTGDFTLQRYKGLGEMDAEQLWETTLDPERRVLKRVEIEDARMASEITEMLMGSEVAPRREFIYEHADEAEIDA